MPDYPPRPLHANMGGPMSRTRRESLSVTVLGRDDGHISCPRVRHVGLNFGDHDPIEAMVHLFALAGITEPEALRDVVDIPAGPLICRPDTTPRRMVVHPAEPTGALRRQRRTPLTEGALTRIYLR
jgi:hypothetical protein